MKPYFVASICKRGILGGGILAEEEEIIFKTGKVSAPAEIRNLRMKYGEIREIRESRYMGLPTVAVEMNSGECHQFLVFGRKRFCALVRERTGGEGEGRASP